MHNIKIYMSRKRAMKNTERSPFSKLRAGVQASKTSKALPDAPSSLKQSESLETVLDPSPSDTTSRISVTLQFPVLRGSE